jgi:hypothetical protein
MPIKIKFLPKTVTKAVKLKAGGTSPYLLHSPVIRYVTELLQYGYRRNSKTTFNITALSLISAEQPVSVVAYSPGCGML